MFYHAHLEIVIEYNQM